MMDFDGIGLKMEFLFVRNELSSDEKTFLEFIKSRIGIKNAIYARDIKTFLGCSAREVRSMVNKLRKLGIPICSGNEGYYIAKDKNELKETLNRLRGQKEDLEYIINALKENI